MSTIKISELNSVETLTESDVLPIVNGTETKRVSIKKLQDVLASRAYVDDTVKASITTALESDY